MRLRKTAAAFLAASLAANTVIASYPTNLAFAAVGSWTDNGDGTYSYTHGDDETVGLENFDLMANSGITDWSRINYVAADVTVDNLTQPYIGGDIGNDWETGTSGWLTSGTTTVYFETGGVTPSYLNLGSWDVNGETQKLYAGTNVTISNLQYTADMPEIIGAWKETNDGWYYTNDSIADDYVSLDIKPIAEAEGIDWTTLKYISATIETTGYAEAGFDINYSGGEADSDWTNGNSAVISNGSNTAYLNVNGTEPAIAQIAFRSNDTNGCGLMADQIVKVTDITFSTEERDMTGVEDEWYEKDGKWYYLASTDRDGLIGGDLTFDISEVTDWSKIKYISVDVKAEGTVNPVLVANDSTVWGKAVLTENETSTLYLITKGETINDLCFMTVWMDDVSQISIKADTLLEISNLQFHDSYEGLADTWYDDNGKWYYQASSDQDALAGGDLTFDISEVTDWSKIKYISVDVKADGTASPVLIANDNAIEGITEITENGTSTINIITYGETIDSLILRTWWLDDVSKISIKADTLLEVGNLQFHDSFEGLTDTWYEDNGKWCYQASENQGWLCGSDLSLPLDGNTDWSKVKYVSADVKADGTANPVLVANDCSIEGNAVLTENGTSTIKLVTNGETISNIYVQIRWIDDVSQAGIMAGTKIEISNLQLHDSYDGITDSWYEDNGKWYYQASSDQDGFAGGDLELDVSEVTDWSKIKYISVDVKADGTANPVLVANDGGIEGGAILTENGTSTINLITNGETVDKLCLQTWWMDDVSKISIKAATLLEVSNLQFHDSYDGITDAWYEENGKWYYEASVNQGWFYGGDFSLDLSEVEDWSKVKYISVDVKADGTANPVLTANDDSIEGISVLTENDTSTITLVTSGKEINNAYLRVWWIDDVSQAGILAGTKLEISNIQFHESFEGITDAWYEDNGKWYFKASKDIEHLDKTFYIDNWSEVEYISANVEVDGEFDGMILQAAIDDDNQKEGNWEETSPAALYVDTYNKEYRNAVFYAHDVKAGTLITISDLTFSTELRDFSDVYDTWYMADEGIFEFKTIDGYESEFIIFSQFMDIDFTGVKYFTADVKVEGKAYTHLTVYMDDFLSKGGQPFHAEDSSDTLYMFCYEDGWTMPGIYFHEMAPDSKITVSNLKYYTDYIKDYTDIEGKWIQTGDNEFYYNRGDLPDGNGGEIPLFYNDYDMSNVQSISMTLKHVLQEGANNYDNAMVHIVGEDDNDWNPGYGFTTSTDERTVVRNYRGILKKGGNLEMMNIKPHMAVYVRDIQLSTTPVPYPEVAEGDILIDDNVTVIGNKEGHFSGCYDLTWLNLAKMTEKGVLKIKVELVDNNINEHWVDPAWNCWGAVWKWEHVFGDGPLQIFEDTVIEIPITDDILDMIHKTSSHECGLVTGGTGIKITQFVFTPKGTNTFTYKDNSDGTITITGGTIVDGNVVIPAEIDGKKVTAIGYDDGKIDQNGLRFNNDIITLTIPEGVKTLGYYCFNSCENLEEVNLPDSLEFIASYAFERCYSLKTINIPASVKVINSGAIAQCYGMTSITCDSDNKFYKAVDGVLFTKDMKTLISYPAGKTGSYTVPASVSNIGDAAFYGAKKLDEVKILGTLDFIGFEAFGDCELLTDVKINDGVNYVGYYAFKGCKNIKQLTVPQSVTNIGDCAFGYQGLQGDKYSDFTLRGYKDSAVYFYAIRHDIPFISMGEVEPENMPFDEELDKEEEIETNPDPAIPEGDKITTITYNPGFNMKDKSEAGVGLDVSEIKIKAKEIYDEEGLKRAEAALGTEIVGKKHYNLLDLTLMHGNKDISKGYDGLVEVVIPIPKGHREKYFYCYRLLDDGTKEIIPGVRRDDAYVIYLEHFSVYALVADEEHKCEFSENWSNDKDNHWHECSCGEKSESAAHTASDWIVETEATTTEKGRKYKDCTICGYILETADIPVIDSGDTDNSTGGSTSDGSTGGSTSGGSTGGSTGGNTGGSTSSGSSRPSTTPVPSVNGTSKTWSEIVSDINKNGADITVQLNGCNNIPADIIKSIADKNITATFVIDSVRSWVLDGSDISTSAGADLSIIRLASLKTSGLRGIEGTQFRINDTNAPSKLIIRFKAEHAGKFANLYKCVDGKFVFVDTVKVDADGQASIPASAKGDYAVMLSEYSDRSGDANNDGITNAMDAAAILKDIVGIEEALNSEMCDFNGDGKVNAADAADILKSIVNNVA